MDKFAPPPPPGNLILEGGFETCPVDAGEMNDGAFNENCVPPWGAANGTPSICDNTDDLYYNPIIPFQGEQFACISSTNSSGGQGPCLNNEAIFQLVTLCPGVSYRLTFAYYNITYEAGTISVALTNGLTNASALDNGSPCFQPNAGSQLLSTTAVPAGDPAWVTVSFEFTPTSIANNQLVFWVNTDQVPSLGFNAGLDALSLVCVDSPVAPSVEVQGDCPNYTFTGSTDSQSGIGVSSWCWDFGDGAMATGQQVSHTYTVSGTYNVCLTVADNCSGCTETVCKAISCDIIPPPQDFTCPCTAQGALNIDASELSPFYDAALGGTPYSLLESAFNYDQNNDGFLDVNDHQGCISILGRLIMDQSLTISSCGNIQMQPCSEIVVGTNALHPTLGMDNNFIFSCERMWHGITVTPHAALTFKGNSIRDAQFAITAQGGSGLGVDPPTRMIAVGNTFSNNHVGVLFPNNAFTTVEHIPFTNNTLNTIIGQSLLPPCDANLPNYSSTQGGFAGIVTLGTPLTVGTPGSGALVNTFSHLRNGIISEGAVLAVHRADFQQIVGAGLGGLPTFAASTGNGVAASGGLVTVLHCNFDAVFRGVYGHDNQRITVQNNTMNHMYRGVETLGAHSSDISNNPAIGFTNRGIMCHEMIPAVGFNSHKILNNTNMFRSAFPGATNNPFPPYPAAIDINNVQSVDVGEVRIMNNHFTGAGLNDGIRINGAGSVDIDVNHVAFQTPNPGIGIQLTNTNNNYLYDNDIVDQASYRPSTGLSLADGSGNRFCCNNTRGSRFGTRFWGACSSTEWRVTTMDSHSFALYCEAGTVIDQQYDYGNLFNPGTGLVFHNGDDIDVLFSQFQVVDMIQPNWPVAILTPNSITDLFIPDGNAASCTAPCIPLPFAPDYPDKDVRETDLVTAAGGWTGGQFGAALQFESERRLYERMLDHEDMVGFHSTTDAFYNSASTNRIGAYANAEAGAKAIYNYPSGISYGLQQSVAQLEAIQSSLVVLLAGLANATTHADSLLIYQDANALHVTSQTVAANLFSYEKQASDLRNQSAQSATALVDALPVDNTLELNRKTIQQIYLQSLGIGIAQLNQQQLAVVEAIALQCPLEGGSAVFAARALCRLNKDRVFMDDSLCLGTQERRQISEITSPVSTVKLAPNPATETVLISGLQASPEKSAVVSLINTSGVVCLERTVAQGESTLDVSTLPNGLYFCRIWSEGHRITTFKLVVAH
ncbi:MAG: T9SS type A sorting domain-containing protein [Saprospiraceae bacterium]|nr:T9SS type A sorting domain-containing protein [Saprospiraceae bacterium]